MCVNLHRAATTLDLDSISATLKALGKYGMTPLELHVFEGTCLYSAAMAEARNQPFETWGVAAQYSLEDLAVALSACTILHSPYSMSIELGERMGVPYLHRLYLLHGGRDQAIRAMFHIEPADHATKSYCSDIQQQQNRMEFSNACALMVWDAPGKRAGVTCNYWPFTNVRMDADISSHIIKACMSKVVENTRCPDCKTAFIVVTEKILTEWDNLQASASTLDTPDPLLIYVHVHLRLLYNAVFAA